MLLKRFFREVGKSYVSTTQLRPGSVNCYKRSTSEMKLGYRWSIVEPWCECLFNVMNDAPCAHLKVTERGIMPVDVVMAKLRWKFVRDLHFIPDPGHPHTREKRLTLLRLLLLIGFIFRTLTKMSNMMKFPSTR